MAENFLAFSGGVSAVQGGKLLAINTATVAAIFSAWSKEHREYQLILLLVNNRPIKIRQDDAPAALEELGLGEFTDSWVLNLAEDLS